MNPIYEDAHLLVLNKPSGLLSVPGLGPDKQDCLSARVQALWPDARVVHRLDQDTSGLLVMARGPEAHRRMGQLFETRQVRKRYVAVVAGAVGADAAHSGAGAGASTNGDADWHTIDGPILLDWERRPLHIVHPTGKPSRSRWRVLQAGAAATLIELEPVTGRTHQLRVHLQHMGHPILGDALYATAVQRAMSTRLLLHAHTLAFAHPFTHTPLAFEAPVDWSAHPPFAADLPAAKPPLSFAAFEAQALADGHSEVQERVWPAHAQVAQHSHPFALRAQVVAGHMWLTVDGRMRYLTAGECFELGPAQPHAERYGAEGATYWVARRHPAA